MAVQKLSSKNQIVIPKEARQAMGVKGGDELLVVVKDDLMLIMRNPKRYAKALQELAKGADGAVETTHAKQALALLGSK